jgi:hypothetical protein
MKEDIIRMALDAGILWSTDQAATLERFAALVAARCAEIADKAEPYRAADLIRKAFAVDPMPLFYDWPGGWKK